MVEPSPLQADSEQDCLGAIDTISYRGEHGVGLLETRLASYSFSSRALADLYARSPNRYEDVAVAPRVIEANIKISKPFLSNPDDCYIDVSYILKKVGLEHALRVADKFHDEIENTNNWEEISEECGVETLAEWLEQSASLRDINQRNADLTDKLNRLYLDCFHYFDDDEEVGVLRSLGYDGALVGSSGSGFGTAEYRVFNKDQIRVLNVEPLDLSSNNNLATTSMTPSF